MPHGVHIDQMVRLMRRPSPAFGPPLGTGMSVFRDRRPELCAFASDWLHFIEVRPGHRTPGGNHEGVQRGGGTWLFGQRLRKPGARRSIDDDPTGVRVEDRSDRLLTSGEVAALFQVTSKTVTRWAAAGRIDSIRTLGGHRRFRESDVLALLLNKQRNTETDI